MSRPTVFRNEALVALRAGLAPADAGASRLWAGGLGRTTNPEYNLPPFTHERVSVPYPVAVADDRPRDASLADWINRARSLCKMCFLGDSLQSSTLRCKLTPRRFLPAALAVGLSSCAGSDGTGPPDAGAPEVASVAVEPRAAMLWETGAQIRYAARVVDRDGREMTGIEVVWSSSEPDVAGVDASGLVTAAANGWTVIRASVGGVTGGADAVIVTPDSPKDRRDCMACHAPEYEARHGGSSTPPICLACHEGQSFSGALDHVTASGGFELLGAHAVLSCQSCHEADETPKFPGVADDECIACHQADYDGQHGGSGFPTTCLECHTRDSFAGATVDHSAASGGFELLGAHETLSCQSCHEADGTPEYPGVADDECIACHQADYDGQHGGSGFPTTCLECHTRDSFAGATVDHSVASGGFELLGAHAVLSCQSCHEADGTPKFPGVADDECIACHQADYDGQHGGSGFPTTCLECHTRDSFAGATFDHDALFFPISSGKHQGKWSGCETCHTDPDDFSTFTCFSCHQHSQDRMDDKHSDVNGYSYDSAACYSCHPDGREP